MKRKISVIGGSGFVGTSFCQLLHDLEIPFEILDLKPSYRFPDHSKIADIRDLEQLLAELSGDVVVNLAAVHRDDVGGYEPYYDTNVFGSQNIVEACRQKSINQIIFVSSVAVYGFVDPDADEYTPTQPFNHYGQTKAEAEVVYKSWLDEAQTDRKLVVVRPTVIFGEGNRGNVYNLFRQIASKQFLMIGSGQNRKSIAYVGNVAKFLLACLDHNERMSLFNYVDQPTPEIQTLVRKTSRFLFGKETRFIRIPYRMGLLIGFAADMISFLIRKNLPISAIRVHKFCAETSYKSSAPYPESFAPACDLDTALENTINAEFLLPEKPKEIFFTE